MVCSQIVFGAWAEAVRQAPVAASRTEVLARFLRAGPGQVNVCLAGRPKAAICCVSEKIRDRLSADDRAS